MSRRDAIGFDRDIELPWLDATAAEVASGATVQEVRTRLESKLEGVLASNGSRSARGKTITVLLRCWSKVPENATGCRDVARVLWAESPPEQRIALHWAMLLATYPFFFDAAANVGRLLGLQENVTLAQLYRRTTEIWGDRSTAVRASRRILRSMVRWGALVDTASRGVYRPAEKRSVLPEIAALLLETLLVGGGQSSLPLADANAHPALFPFRLPSVTHILRRSTRVRLHRQGLDMDVIELA